MTTTMDKTKFINYMIHWLCVSQIAPLLEKYDRDLSEKFAGIERANARVEFLALDHDLDRARARALDCDLDHALDRALALALDLARDRDRALDLARAFDLAFALDCALDHARDCDLDPYWQAFVEAYVYAGGNIENLKSPKMNNLILDNIQNNPASFDMAIWHNRCGTVSCMAGHIAWHVEGGRELESIVGTRVASCIISYTNDSAIPDFYDTSEGANERALAALRKRAALENERSE